MDPITLGIIGIGAGTLWVLKRLRGSAPVAAPQCTSADVSRGIQNTAGGAASGAAAGASAGPYGAGAGAGLGVALGATSFLSGPCGAKIGKEVGAAIHNAGLSVCAKADMVYAHIRAAGADIPGYAHMSCDEKLAACLAAATPLGIVVAGITTAGYNAVQGAQNAYTNVTDTTTKAGGGSVTVAGHKIF